MEIFFTRNYTCESSLIYLYMGGGGGSILFPSTAALPYQEQSETSPLSLISDHKLMHAYKQAALYSSVCVYLEQVGKRFKRCSPISIHFVRPDHEVLAIQYAIVDQAS